jgi:hypothetical protein
MKGCRSHTTMRAPYYHQSTMHLVKNMQATTPFLVRDFVISANACRISVKLVEAELLGETAEPRVKRLFLFQSSSGISRIPCQLRCTSSITPRENDIYKQKVDECVTQHCFCPASYMTQHYPTTRVSFCYHLARKVPTFPCTLDLEPDQTLHVGIRVTMYHTVEHPSSWRPKCIKDYHC